MTATVDAFDAQFAGLTGHPPFCWQRRLFECLMAGEQPTALDLPTGLGKTSVMAVWLLARAHQADLPRRLVYVVDRRAVVDQATTEAVKLRTALEKKPKLAELKEALGLGDRPLPISTLRGAFMDKREWLADPSLPAIIVGTVDMIGSRLLFSGYGVSRKMRPYHAGLLGADTLVVLDEAHLVPPFENLLEAIEGGAKTFGPAAQGDCGIVPAFKLLSLSATGRERKGKVFRLEAEDLDDNVVAQRLIAPKAVTIETGEAGTLAERLAAEAWKLTRDGADPIRCVIYCNHRGDAEKVKARLNKLAHGKQGREKPDTELFVGARRVKEREDANNWLKWHGFFAGWHGPPWRPAILIATSAGEVGVDLDAEHMVCDLVPWERMVQRFGRVNRRGEGNACIIIVDEGLPKPKKADEPTEQEMRALIAYRSLPVIAALPKTGRGFDGSPGALRDLKLRGEHDKDLKDGIDAATTPAPLYPALSRALVDAWSMTSLEKHTGRPEVAPWLRGWIEEDKQTSVIWRKYLPVRIDRDNWPNSRREEKKIEVFFEATPPHESEKLETETRRVAIWLKDRASDLLKHQQDGSKSTESNVADADATTSDAINVDASEKELLPAQTKTLRREDIVAIALLRSGEYAARYKLEDLARERKGKAKDDFHDELIGKLLVIDARFGGLDAGMLAAASNLSFETADGSDSWSREVGFRVRQPGADDKDWRFESDFAVRCNDEGDALESLLVEHFRDAAQREDARSISKPQELAKHQAWAEQRALRIAEKVGLTGVRAEVLGLAAALHDEGKRAERWQRAFKAPRDAKKFGLVGPLAKTRGPIDQADLDGYRHEFGSLRYVEKNAKFQALPDEWRQLILHLVAAHHGFARPVISTQGCEDAPPSALEGRARDVALRFARLQKRWGPWGLAWWEALLRAADQQASRDNDAPAEKGDAA